MVSNESDVPVKSEVLTAVFRTNEVFWVATPFRASREFWVLHWLAPEDDASKSLKLAVERNSVTSRENCIFNNIPRQNLILAAVPYDTPR